MTAIPGSMRFAYVEFTILQRIGGCIRAAANLPPGLLF